VKRLILVRHAKSSWDNPGLKDFDRPLSQRGLADAALMGGKITLRPNHVLSSSAERTRQTVELLLEEMGMNPDAVEFSDALYHASCHQLLQSVTRLRDNHDCAMLVAHNPGVAEFIEEFTNIRPARVPTCSVFTLGYQVSSWGDVEHTRPGEQEFLFPGMYRD